ncbi:hypothetical protein NUV26_15895, partial [Burkholderia pseudomultivorans]|uniref:hypothetical protein n=1 Tax=Burkholderia pseudomultivorans TaxID=1207504 RepID=UPI0028750FCE
MMQSRASSRPVLLQSRIERAGERIGRQPNESGRCVQVGAQRLVDRATNDVPAGGRFALRRAGSGDRPPRI